MAERHPRWGLGSKVSNLQYRQTQWSLKLLRKAPHCVSIPSQGHVASFSSGEEAHYCVFRSALKDIVYAGARLHLKACSYNFIVLEAQGNQTQWTLVPHLTTTCLGHLFRGWMWQRSHYLNNYFMASSSLNAYGDFVEVQRHVKQLHCKSLFITFLLNT